MTRNLIRIFLLWIGLLSGILSAQAQIEVSVPSRVATGENFRLAYTINTQDVEDFRGGSIPAGLLLVAGPYTSQQASFQMINGHASGSSSITYTYTLYAEKPGTYTIPAARARVNGSNVSSRAVKVTVTGQPKRNGSGSARIHQDDDGGMQMRTVGSRISGNDLFIKVSANKSRVYEQEPVLLTYKVYTQVNLTQLNEEMPNLTGFQSQKVELPGQKSYKVETVNGRPYKTVTWSRYVLYPQMAGKLEIPAVSFKGFVVQRNLDVDPMEAFFNGGSGFVEVKREIRAPGLAVQVDPLPDKPSGFSGGVGRFNISAQLNKTEVKAGNPITMRIVVGGTGNLKLIKFPEVNLPKNFDKYDPKVTDKTRLTPGGVEGNMVYDLLFVPRSEGKYTIPAVEFCYFDIQAKAYKTVKTKSFDITVGKSDGTNTVASYDTPKDNDIRNIMSGEAQPPVSHEAFVGSVMYWVSLLLPLLAFVILMIIFRKRALSNADVISVRRKKADKIARKRLNRADMLMRQGRSVEFYDEVLRALWDYAAYKLNMPVGKLSRDNIAGAFAAHGVHADVIRNFISALDICEYERYAPGGGSGNMEHTYSAAAGIITEIENIMKKKHRL